MVVYIQAKLGKNVEEDDTRVTYQCEIKHEEMWINYKMVIQVNSQGPAPGATS